MGQQKGRRPLAPQAGDSDQRRGGLKGNDQKKGQTESENSESSVTQARNDLDGHRNFDFIKQDSWTFSVLNINHVQTSFSLRRTQK